MSAKKKEDSFGIDKESETTEKERVLHRVKKKRSVNKHTKMAQNCVDNFHFCVHGA